MENGSRPLSLAGAVATPHRDAKSGPSKERLDLTQIASVFGQDVQDRL